MQRSASCGTEEAVKNSANHELSLDISVSDVEKAAVKPPNDAIAKEFVHSSDQNGQGLIDQKALPNSDASTLAEEEDEFPEGGLRGYGVVAGAFCGLFSVFGIINSTGILLDYFSTHQLKDYTSSQIGWYVYLSTLEIFLSIGTLLNSFFNVILPSLTRKRIFGLALFLTFFCGAPIGPLFDAYGPRLLMVCGSVLLIASMFLLGLCTRE